MTEKLCVTRVPSFGRNLRRRGQLPRLVDLACHNACYIIGWGTYCNPRTAPCLRCVNPQVHIVNFFY